ncbi:MAG: glycosyltransferase family 39 protein [Bacteroidota bacterium]
MKTKYHKYIILFVICMISLFFQLNTLNQFPQYKHNWAQCDRYALSLGFINNGGDLLHPETFIYNNQFPGDFKTIRNTTITSVDFPIHDYIVSVLMRLFNTQDPWCFRIYVFLYSIIGLFFLYRLCKLFTDSLLISVCVVLFAISSPVFLYYQAGFLPTIPSLANCIIALFFLFRFFKNDQKKDFYLTVFFITLAALSRLPFAIFLVAMMCLEFLEAIKTKKIKLFVWVSFGIAIGLIYGYYLYNGYLRSEHGSVFLNYIIPASSLDELIEFAYATYDRWMFKYFTHIHYVLLGILGTLFIWNMIRKKIALSKLESRFMAFCFILFAGCICYYILMTFQYLDHDYYFLDTFYVPFVFLFLLFVTKLPPISNTKILRVTGILILLSFIPALIYANFVQDGERKTSGEKTTVENFQDAVGLLDSLQIPVDSKILVMAADGPNNPFILMKRKGFAVIYPGHDMIKYALSWPYNYVVLENTRLINSVYREYPEVSNELRKIGGNENISVFVKNTGNKKNDFDTFFNLTEMQVKYKQRISFDTIPDNCEGIDSLSSFAYSGKRSGYMDKKNEYGVCTKIINFSPLNKHTSILKVNTQFSSPDELKECFVCVSITSKDKEILFSANDISHFTITKEWSRHVLLFNIPKIEETEYLMKIFVWNKGKNKLFYDDFETLIYQ